MGTSRSGTNCLERSAPQSHRQPMIALVRVRNLSMRLISPMAFFLMRWLKYQDEIPATHERGPA